MPIGLIFWVLMLLWLVLGFVPQPAGSPAPLYLKWGGTLLLFILLVLLGWDAFGPAVRR